MIFLMFGLAIASGVAGTLSTRASRGFTRLPYAVAAVASYTVATLTEAWLVQRVPVGIVYAVWTGTAAAVLLGIDRFVFGERTTRMQVAGTALVLVGVGLLGTVLD
jgi:small multidrug resistance pump